MTTSKFLVMISCVFLISAASCRECKECYYIIENSSGKTEESMGEFCGDEIKALEKKDHYDPLGDASVECR